MTEERRMRTAGTEANGWISARGGEISAPPIPCQIEADVSTKVKNDSVDLLPLLKSRRVDERRYLELPSEPDGWHGKHTRGIPRASRTS